MRNRLGFLDFENEDSTFDVFKGRGKDEGSLIFGLTPLELTCLSTVNCGFKADVEEILVIEVVFTVETILGGTTTVDEFRVDEATDTTGEGVDGVVATRREEGCLVFRIWAYEIPSLTYLDLTLLRAARILIFSVVAAAITSFSKE